MMFSFYWTNEIVERGLIYDDMTIWHKAIWKAAQLIGMTVLYIDRPYKFSSPCMAGTKNEVLQRCKKTKREHLLHRVTNTFK